MTHVDPRGTGYYYLPVTENELTKGDRVKVVSGIYKGTEGVVDDVQLECSVVRIMDKEGENVYALAETVKKMG